MIGGMKAHCSNTGFFAYVESWRLHLHWSKNMELCNNRILLGSIGADSLNTRQHEAIDTARPEQACTTREMIAQTGRLIGRQWSSTHRKPKGRSPGWVGGGDTIGEKSKTTST